MGTPLACHWIGNPSAEASRILLLECHDSRVDKGRKMVPFSDMSRAMCCSG